VRVLAWGLALTVVVTAVLYAAWGRAALVAGVTFGALATAIQVGAVALVRPVVGAPFAAFIKRWGVGMGLRLLGVVIFVVAVSVDRQRFPPLATAFGYLGVLLPLLFTETRFLR
jgi:hypothetical protein